MNKKLTAFLAAWLLIALTVARAQTGLVLRGNVKSATRQPLDGVTVYLSRAADSVLVKTALTEADGSYVFTKLKSGSYRLAISMVGYQNYKSSMINLQRDTMLPPVTLQQAAQLLKEVSVTAQRPFVEHLIDRVVVNADALISSAGGTVFEMLEKSPGVLVDQNGGISLQGKDGVKIYIDDKPTYLSGEDLANYLRSLPSSTIDRIELMSNPPAKYDAAGNGGIINIRTKRIRETGFNGSLNLGYTEGIYGRSNNSLNLNYRHDKLNVAASLGYSEGSNFSNVDLNRYFDPAVITGISPNFMQTSFIKRQSQSYSTRLTIDYYTTDKTTLGIGLTGLLTDGNSHTLSTSKLTNLQNQPDSSILADNINKRVFKNGGINLNYRHNYDKKGTELTADLDYITYHTQRSQDFINNSYYPDGTLYYNEQETGNLPPTLIFIRQKQIIRIPWQVVSS